MASQSGSPGVNSPTGPVQPRRKITFPANLANTLKLVITNFSGFDDFYGQFASISSDMLKRFVKDLVEHYRGYNSVVDNAFCDGNNPAGQFCAALFGTEYYRCKVVEDLGEERARVYYTDYGNTSDVDKKYVFPLAAEVSKFIARSLH